MDCDLIQLPNGKFWCRRPGCDPTKTNLEPRLCRRNCHSKLPATPPVRVQVAHYVAAIRRWRKAGRPRRSDAEVDFLLAICRACPLYDADKKRCRQRGCRATASKTALVNKLRMATESCPIGRWGMMPLTQLVSFEIGTECQLGDYHLRCPNRHPDRYAGVDVGRAIDEEKIVDLAVRLWRDFRRGVSGSV